MRRELPRFEFDPVKFKHLVHYICDVAPNPRQLGATRLNKILFYSDTQAFLETGSPITGEVYVKQKLGPLPKHIGETLAQLKAEEAVAISEARLAFNVYQDAPYRQRMFLSLREPALDAFSAKEIHIVDAFVSEITERHTATSISEESHDLIWEITDFGEEIPYYASWLRTLEPAGEHAVAWAQRISSERS
jgi:hypothetical protein